MQNLLWQSRKSAYLIKHIRFIILVCFINNITSAQNLVVNPSGEDTVSCANWVSLGAWPRFPCIPWYQTTGSTSDYFNEVYSLFCGSAPAPTNAIGFQFPKTGFAYFGVLVRHPTLLNSRDYISGNLSDSLKVGHKYCVQFYASAANNCKYVTDDIGIYFSSDSVYDPNTQLNLSYQPQVENIQGNILSDTLNWMLVSDDFIAQGGEKYLTLGNFKTDSLSTWDSIGGSTQDCGYYYIDDISVTDCTVGIKEVRESNFLILPNPTGEKLKIKSEKLKIENVQLYDVVGEIVLQMNCKKENEIELDISSLAPGLYFVQIKTQRGVHSRKVVKE